MHFEFITVPHIVFGRGVVQDVGSMAVKMGHRPLVITGSSTIRAKPVLDILTAQGIEYSTFSITGEPSTETVRHSVQLARQANRDFIIGIGGGSVLDTGKATAILLTNGGDPLDYVEVIGRGSPLTKPPVPYIAIPTTASGAEVTRNAVLASKEHRVKISIRSPLMLPRLAVIDPELTYSLPPEVTASTGLDALAQVIEPYVSNKANPMTDVFCREGIKRAARSLRRAYEKGDDPVAREDMSFASLLGGIALGNAKLGVVHGFASVVGGMFPAPHGIVCGSLLPHVMAINVRAMKERLPESEALRRYDEVSQIMTGNLMATSSDGVEWLKQLCKDLRIPSLASCGVTRDDFPMLVDKASVASSTKGNPVQLNAGEMQEILKNAL